MAKNEAKIRFTAETGEFNDSIKKSNDEMSRLRAEMKLNEAQMKSAGTSVEGLENKHKILSEQLAASESKTQALSQKVDKAAEIFGENSTEVNKLRTQLLNAQTAEEKIRQAINACNAELEDQRKAANQTKTATEQLADTIDEQQGELNKLKAEYAEVVLQYGKTSKEAKTLAKQIDSLSSDLAENQKKMNAAESAADKLDNSLDDVGDSAKDASEGFTVLKGAMADLVADGIEGVVEGFKDISTEAFTMANDIDKATNTFIAKTGESTDKAGEFEEAITSIYNGNYGESFEDISEAMATIKTTMGDIGTSKLENLTKQALVLRDTFDLDVNESIRGVNSLMDQFGITADQAYNLIAQGAQKGLNQNGDLLDVVNEYAMQFKTAGFSAEDMFNMLANGVEAGTWSVDKLGDAVKEFNIRASDGTVSKAILENGKVFGLTKQQAESLASSVANGNVGAYKKLASQLKSVDDDTQRYQLGVAMFGTMWEDLGEEAVYALLNTKGEITTTSDALKKINEVKYDDLGSAMEGIKRNLQTSMTEPIQNEVMPAVNEFIEDVDWQGVGQTIGEAFGTIVQAGIAVATAIKDAVHWMNEHKAVVIAVASVVGVLVTAITAYNIVQGIKTAMDAANVTTVWALVAAHIAQAAAAMAAIAPYVLIVAAIAAVIAIIVLCVKYWDEIVAAVKKCWQAVCDTLSGWGEWINANVIQPIAKFFSGLWDGICKVFSNVGGWFSEKFTQAKEKATAAWSNAKAKFGETWNKIKDAFANVGSWFSEKFTQAKEKATSAWSNAKEKFSNIWSNTKSAFSNVGSWFKDTFAKAKENSVNAFNNIKEKFTGIKDKVTSAFSNIKEKLTKPFEKARDAIKGVVDKIKGFFSGLKLKFPNIKMPHFKITGKFSLSPPSVPKLSIDWYKEGGIFTKPTIFGTQYGFKGVGEAGAEAVLPIDKLEGYMVSAIEKTQNVVNLQSLANAIEELANRPIQMNINGRQFALATAGDGDSVNGLRSSFKSRGLTFD